MDLSGVPCLSTASEITEQLWKADCKSGLFPLEAQEGKTPKCCRNVHIGQKRAVCSSLCSKYGKGGELKHPTHFAKIQEKSHTRQK